MAYIKFSNVIKLACAAAIGLYGCTSMQPKQQLTPLPDIKDAKASFKAGNYPRAVAQLRPLAESGNADAQYCLGYLYYYGKGIEQDKTTGTIWIRKAAEQGQPLALSAIALIDDSTNDTDQNPAPSEPVKQPRAESHQGASHDLTSNAKYVTQPVAKADDKQNAHSDVKTAVKTDTNVDTKAVAKSDVKIDSKAVAKSDSKTDSKAVAKSDNKIDSKAVAKSDNKIDSKAVAKSDNKIDSKAVAKSDSKIDSKAVAKSDSKTDSKTDSKAVAKSDSKDAAKLDAKLEAKLDAKSSSKSDTKSADKTDDTNNKSSVAPITAPF